MKPTKPLLSIFSLLFVAAIFLSACGNDSNNSPDDDNHKTIANNSNSNLKDGNRYTHRLEFPQLKGGKSIVITHIDQSAGEVNYSLNGTAKRNRIVGLAISYTKVTANGTLADGMATHNILPTP